MMTPCDTALLAHRPDHLRPVTEAELLATQLDSGATFSLRSIIGRIFRVRPWTNPSAAPHALTDTRF